MQKSLQKRVSDVTESSGTQDELGDISSTLGIGPTKYTQVSVKPVIYASTPSDPNKMHKPGSLLFHYLGCFSGAHVLHISRDRGALLRPATPTSIPSMVRTALPGWQSTVVISQNPRTTPSLLPTYCFPVPPPQATGTVKAYYTRFHRNMKCQVLTCGPSSIF